MQVMLNSVPAFTLAVLQSTGGWIPLSKPRDDPDTNYIEWAPSQPSHQLKPASHRVLLWTLLHPIKMSLLKLQTYLPYFALSISVTFLLALNKWI